MQTIADAMGLASAEAAAAGIVDIVNENMLGGLRLVSVQQGFDPRDFALVAFGGAGPLHANALGRLTGAWPVIVPPSPGVLCALGDATTSARDESARTVLRKLSELDAAELRTVFAELAEAASQRLVEQGVPAESQVTTYSGRPALRRPGQRAPGHLRRRAARRAGRGRAAGPALRRRARAAVLLHPARRARAGQRAGHGHRAAAAAWRRSGWNRATATSRPARTGDTRIYVDGDFVDAGLYDRLKLRAGDVVAGPAIVVEMDSTTLVLPGHAATADAGGSLLIRPSATEA